MKCKKSINQGNLKINQSGKLKIWKQDIINIEGLNDQIMFTT